ncbi:MAG: hypothetical protein GWN67_15575 [Phycisphaerae bacterium]|nr:hypothetical protein [Phycisphaerae bacterium]NIR65779.1 hypothetical protein [candidate division Zixibacteria bacterium]NIP51055.1 hypothetical protein [Phycisphaerae bacterium]NIS52499.1 hypothetical protein [Phycisphaerae bacterium]NIU10034.1 hypothetical protein [Phycisphaerae bacterium]
MKRQQLPGVQADSCLFFITAFADNKGGVVNIGFDSLHYRSLIHNWAKNGKNMEKNAELS